MLSQRARAAGLTGAYYAAIFFAFGAQLPYMPVWLEAWGLSRVEIGYFFGAATVARIAGATLLPALADRYAIRRWMIATTSMLSALALLAHLLIGAKELLFAATLVLALVNAPAVPIGEALGLRAAGRFGFAYAPVRAAGSVAFLVANIAVGAWVGRMGPDIVIWVTAGGLGATAVIGAMHPGGGAAAGSGTDRAAAGEALRLAMVPVFALFACTAAIGQAGHVVYYVYSVLDWQAQGISTATIGWLWAIGVIAETALMLGPGRAWVQRLGAGHALALAAVAGMLRWSVMAVGPPLGALWMTQALHALTFGLGHLGAMAFIAQAVPARLTASAQGLFSGIAGGGAHALALLAAAALVEKAGFAAAYWMAAGLTASSAIGALILSRVWAGDTLIAEKHGPPAAR